MLKDDMISRSALLKHWTMSDTGRRYPLHDCDNFPTTVTLSEVQNSIRAAPTVNVTTVTHGRWIADMHGQATMVCHCSICGCQKALIDGNYTMFKYCSDCGAKMDGNERMNND